MAFEMPPSLNQQMRELLAKDKEKRPNWIKRLLARLKKIIVHKEKNNA